MGMRMKKMKKLRAAARSRTGSDAADVNHEAAHGPNQQADESASTMMPTYPLSRKVAFYSAGDSKTQLHLIENPAHGQERSRADKKAAGSVMGWDYAETLSPYFYFTEVSHKNHQLPELTLEDRRPVMMDGYYFWSRAHAFYYGKLRLIKRTEPRLDIESAVSLLTVGKNKSYRDPDRARRFVDRTFSDFVDRYYASVKASPVIASPAAEDKVSWPAFSAIHLRDVLLVTTEQYPEIKHLLQQVWSRNCVVIFKENALLTQAWLGVIFDWHGVRMPNQWFQQLSRNIDRCIAAARNGGKSLRANTQVGEIDIDYGNLVCGDEFPPPEIDGNVRTYTLGEQETTVMSLLMNDVFEMTADSQDQLNYFCSYYRSNEGKKPNVVNIHFNAANIAQTFAQRFLHYAEVQPEMVSLSGVGVFTHHLREGANREFCFGVRVKVESYSQFKKMLLTPRNHALPHCFYGLSADSRQAQTLTTLLNQYAPPDEPVDHDNELMMRRKLLAYGQSTLQVKHELAPIQFANGKRSLIMPLFFREQGLSHFTGMTVYDHHHGKSVTLFDDEQIKQSQATLSILAWCTEQAADKKQVLDETKQHYLAANALADVKHFIPHQRIAECCLLSSEVRHTIDLESGVFYRNVRKRQFVTVAENVKLDKDKYISAHIRPNVSGKLFKRKDKQVATLLTDVTQQRYQILFDQANTLGIQYMAITMEGVDKKSTGKYYKEVCSARASALAIAVQRARGLKLFVVSAPVIDGDTTLYDSLNYHCALVDGLANTPPIVIVNQTSQAMFNGLLRYVYVTDPDALKDDASVTIAEVVPGNRLPSPGYNFQSDKEAGFGVDQARLAASDCLFVQHPAFNPQFEVAATYQYLEGDAALRPEFM